MRRVVSPASVRRGWASARAHARGADLRQHPLPNFVIIGAQRSGTSWLYRQLAAHPHVRSPVRKEVHFLSLHWDRGLPWYRRHFPVLREPDHRTFEATPYYLFHPDAPVRAAAALPDATFVALLRDPSARAFSHFRHNATNGVEPLDFESALASEADRLAQDPTGRNHRLYSYMARGLYADQIRRWKAAVGDRLLVVLSEDLFDDPRPTLARIQDFVGLTPWETDALPTHPIGSSVHDATTPATIHRRLQERFAAPNRELAGLIGRDLSKWSDGVTLPSSSSLRRVR